MTTQDTTQFDAADLEPISSASSADALQRIMDTARAGAEAQAELEAAGEDPFAEAEPETPETPASTETPAEAPADKPAETAPESTEEQPEEEEAEEPPEPKAEKSKPGEPTYSRRDAARFKADLDAAKAELQEARAVAQQHQASDTSIMQAIREQAGDEREFQSLVQKVVSGKATPEEQQRASVMQQWRTVAGPIYRTAQQQVVASWGSAFKAAGELDGMTDDARQQVMAAADPKVALELIHNAGLKAGEERTRAELQADIKKTQAENTRLKAEVSSLKAKVVTTKPQPATPDGTSPAAGPKLPPMLNADGTLNPEFEKLASSGKLYGVERLTG